MTDSGSVEISADGTRVFVTTRRAASSLVTTSITNASSGATVRSVTVNESHSGFRYNDDGSRLYVYESLGNSSKVTIIDTTTGEAAEPLFVDGCNPRLTFTRDGTRAIVTTTGSDADPAVSRVAFVDTDTGRIVAPAIAQAGRETEPAGSAAGGAQAQGQQ